MTIVASMRNCLPGSDGRVHRKGDSPPVDKDEFTRHRRTLLADNDGDGDEDAVMMMLIEVHDNDHFNASSY